MTDFDYRELDDVIHSRIRLAVMALLASLEDAEFTWLRDRVGATDGNLSTHMGRLLDAGYVAQDKRFVDNKPLTRYALTPTGQRAFQAYVDRMERLLGGVG